GIRVSSPLGDTRRVLDARVRENAERAGLSPALRVGRPQKWRAPLSMPRGTFASSDPTRGRLSHCAAWKRGFFEKRSAPRASGRSGQGGRRKTMTPTDTKPRTKTGAELLVQNLEAQDVEYIFGIPGAKIDKVFDSLLGSKVKTVVCRHEQNAAFIAGGIGRM